jgi:hypothetical protein
VEQHAALRFARLKEHSPDDAPLEEGAISRLILTIYNIVWWLPLALTLTKVIDFRAGSVSFLAITLFRAAANVVRVNILAPEQAQVFPLRSP